MDLFRTDRQGSPLLNTLHKEIYCMIFNITLAVLHCGVASYSVDPAKHTECKSAAVNERGSKKYVNAVKMF